MANSLNSKTITVQQVGKKTGKFVLFIRCGSQYPLCLNNYFENDDVLVVLSLYQHNSFQIENDFWVITGGLSKFDSARLFFSLFPEFTQFQAFAFFDPDVAIDFFDINSLFIKGMADNKAIYQAAVAADSHTYWKFLLQGNTHTWREVSFVEVMAPFFSRYALTLVVNNFSDSISTWGLEYLWYSACKKLNMAVYDPIVMRHDAKVDLSDGPFYRYLASMKIDPFLELQKLRKISVSKYYVECSVPLWVPLYAKNFYVDILGATISLKERFYALNLKKISKRLATRNHFKN